MTGLTSLSALGLMSGTSMDGIDVALLRTDGDTHVERGPAASYPYPPAVRARIVAAVAAAAGLADRAARPGVLAEVERELTLQHVEAVRRFLTERGIAAGTIDVIGFHGQTVLHRPHERLTMQLGDGPLLAAGTGIDVVYDLRAADVEAGGQGAPLAPVYHRALAGRLPERPCAVLNVGGVANVTWIGRTGQLIAFDTGPGNALIDDWVLRHTGVPRDEGGRLALAGCVNKDALIGLLSHPFFAALPPKSLDRNAFSAAPVEALSPADGAATLTAFTAEAVRRALSVLPEPPAYWLICGGGRRNTALMLALAERLEAAVAPAEAAGLDGDALEAEAWAYLAVRSLNGLPITYPGTTGVERPLTGGVLARAP